MRVIGSATTFLAARGVLIITREFVRLECLERAFKCDGNENEIAARKQKKEKRAKRVKHIVKCVKCEKTLLKRREGERGFGKIFKTCSIIQKKGLRTARA